ncbi:hypothetical protein ANCDUO_24927 [Ancylostoma duodenale]|uniref:Exportin-1/Importin-beta-like domain-containing protein n=1 Tax=Ancylostoma duodenale TaxID=51022 RepID=A0A0C2C5T4_9BILA|nr:hypothetical protein ANCDUO_24927 [Ancylostoma duodenale]
MWCFCFEKAEAEIFVVLMCVCSGGRYIGILGPGGIEILCPANPRIRYSDEIVKQDWPKNWPSFITDIVESSKTNDNICVNNMNILSLLRS